MKKRRKLNTNEKFLISFIVVLIIAIAFNWKNFSQKIKTSFDSHQTKEVPAE